MKKITLNQKRLSDQRLGLLGLHTSKENESVACPTSDDMALFAEQKSDPWTKTRLMDHIASCEQCYEEWLLLTEHAEGKAPVKKGKLYKIYSAKSLAAIGSGLALAASVALYFNLPKDQMEEAKVFMPPEKQKVVIAESVPEEKQEDVGMLLETLLDEAGKEKGGLEKSYPSITANQPAPQKKRSTPPLAKMSEPQSTVPDEMEPKPRQQEMATVMVSASQPSKLLQEFYEDLVVLCNDSTLAVEKEGIFKKLQATARILTKRSAGLTPQQVTEVGEIAKGEKGFNYLNKEKCELLLDEFSFIQTEKVR